MRVWFNGKTTAFQAVVASSILVTRLWSVGQGVKTPPFHGGNTSSNLVRTICQSKDVKTRRAFRHDS